MKSFLLIILFFLNSCSIQQEEDKLIGNPIVKTIYTADQINQLEVIIDRIDSLVISKNETMNLSESYHAYCAALINSDNVDGLEDLLKIDRPFYNKLVLDIMESDIFDETWIFDKVGDIRTGEVSYILLAINIQGKYLELLKKLSEQEIIPKGYYDVILSTGDIAASIALGLLANHQDYDFNDPIIRLVFCVHFITLHYLMIPE